jgi:hypothetical protein
MDFFGSLGFRCFMGAIVAIAGLANLLLDDNAVVGIGLLVFGVLIIGQGLGIVPMFRHQRRR